VAQAAVDLLLAGHTRLTSRTVSLTATSWAPSVESCPEGPTRLDREIRVGVPARGADGSGRRTAGRWVAPPAVAAVRFSGLRVVGRDSLERDSGRPWEFLGALMTPRGPIGREQAGSPAGHPDGALGGCPSQSSGHPHQAPGPGSATYHGGTRPAASAVPGPAGHRPSSSEPTHLSAVLAVDLAVSRCPSHGRFRSCRRPPRFCRAGTARAGWQLLARVPAVTAQRP
jgi:hypothetical protein